MTTLKQKDIDERLGKQILDEMLSMPTAELKRIAMKINLDDLESKARAVNCPETWDSGDFASWLERNHADYIDAIKPETVLALVRIVRETMYLQKNWGNVWRYGPVFLETILREVE